MKFKPVVYLALLLMALGGALWFTAYDEQNRLPPYCTPKIIFNTLQASVQPLLTSATVDCGRIGNSNAQNAVGISCLKNALLQGQPFSIYRRATHIDFIYYEWLVGTADQKLYQFNLSGSAFDEASPSCGKPVTPSLICEKGLLDTTLAPWQLRLTCQSETAQCPNPRLKVSTIDWTLGCDTP